MGHGRRVVGVLGVSQASREDADFDETTFQANPKRARAQRMTETGVYVPPPRRTVARMIAEAGLELIGGAEKRKRVVEMCVDEVEAILASKHDAEAKLSAVKTFFRDVLGFESKQREIAIAQIEAEAKLEEAQAGKGLTMAQVLKMMQSELPAPFDADVPERADGEVGLSDADEGRGDSAADNG